MFSAVADRNLGSSERRMCLVLVLPLDLAVRQRLVASRGLTYLVTVSARRANLRRKEEVEEDASRPSGEAMSPILEWTKHQVAFEVRLLER